MKTEESRFKIETILSILSLIMAPVFSWVVVDHQLANEHRFVDEQRRNSDQEQKNTRQRETLREVIKLCSELQAWKKAALDIIYHETTSPPVLPVQQNGPAGALQLRKHSDEDVRELRRLVLGYKSRDAELGSLLNVAVFQFKPQVVDAIQAYLTHGIKEGTGSYEENKKLSYDELETEKKIMLEVINAMAREVSETRPDKS